MSEALENLIRSIPDFPKKGILFRDITPALADPSAFGEICRILANRLNNKGIDKIAGIESRGFIFGSAVSYITGKGFIPLRKPGKLPWKTYMEKYSLEYGEAALEMHIDAVSSGERVAIIDDLLATGGTAAAAARLIEKAGGEVAELDFLIELEELNGRNNLEGHEVFSVMRF